MCPHQVSTSVSASTSAASPCSGCSSVAVRTRTRSPSDSVRPAAIAACIPSGYSARTSSRCVVDVSPHTVTRSNSLTRTPLAGGQPNSNPRGIARSRAGSPYRGVASLMRPCTACSPLITSPGPTWKASERSDRRSGRAAAPRSPDAPSAAARLRAADRPRRAHAPAPQRRGGPRRSRSTPSRARSRPAGAGLRQRVPPSKRARKRWLRVWVGEHTGAGLPPIDVVQVGDGYAIRDGHHRVSVARARGAVHDRRRRRLGADDPLSRTSATCSGSS